MPTPIKHKLIKLIINEIQWEWMIEWMNMLRKSNQKVWSKMKNDKKKSGQEKKKIL